MKPPPILTDRNLPLYSSKHLFIAGPRAKAIFLRLAIAEETRVAFRILDRTIAEKGVKEEVVTL